ncbi:MAG: sugar ABC transporter substrate-binding protein [Kamptonema sp. SIO4C4]|nr:sugar ABC transporter substrate-binding protein [Kamptonema sp. SIO4C4]
MVQGLTIAEAEEAIATAYEAAQLVRKANVTLQVAAADFTPSFPSATSTTGITQEAPYTLGPGDNISIEIFQIPQYSGEQEVLIDGTLNLSRVGQLSVAGMTIPEVETAIATAYENARILRNPSVTVRLLTPRPVRIGIAGEVNRPGSYILERQGTQFPTLTQALQTAGGITQTANLRSVEIQRSNPRNPDQTYTVNLWDLIQTGNLKDDPIVRDGDTIFIPTATQPSLAEVSRIPNASFAPESIPSLNIVVIGEVFRPGPYTVGGTARTGQAGVPGGGGGGQGVSPTVTRAIQSAGGIKPQADVRNIRVRRLTSNQSQQTLTVNLWELLQEGDARQDIVLQEGDTIIVPRAETLTPEEASQLATASFSPDQISVNIVGEVERPGTLQVPPNTPVNQAILAAGGFNIRAQDNHVDLIRLNPDGTITRRPIPVDFGQGINEETNPVLRNEDIILVYTSGLSSFSDLVSEATRPFSGLLNFLLIPFRIFNLFE